MLLRNLKARVSNRITHPVSHLSFSSSSKAAHHSFLTQAQAKSRFSLFDPSKTNQISYDLILKIAKGDTYQGRVDVNFSLSQLSDDLFLDYAGTNVDGLSINSKHLESSDKYKSYRRERFLYCPQQSLSKGENQLSIDFSNKYVNDGNGLHSFC